MSAPEAVEKFYRHEYGRLVAGLIRRFGVHRLEAVEDAAQGALLTALETWTTSEIPENPSAWLFHVAHNRVLDELRKQTRRRRLLEERGEQVDARPAHSGDAPGEVSDDLLRLIFLCCDDDIPVESQLVLALKLVLGFDVQGIALRLFSSESAVYKRLSRAREALTAEQDRLPELTTKNVEERLPSVRRIIYLLFTEGHLSFYPEMTIRMELCREAIRLGSILAGHSDLHRRCGHASTAERYRDVAVKTAPSDAVRELLSRRLHQASSD